MLGMPFNDEVFGEERNFVAVHSVGDVRFVLGKRPQLLAVERFDEEVGAFRYVVWQATLFRAVGDGNWPFTSRCKTGAPARIES
jgi:hypothetical protein